MVRGVNLSNLAIKATEMKTLNQLISEASPKQFFVWKDVLYYDGYKRKRASDEVVATQELIDMLEMRISIEELTEVVRDRLQT